MSRTLEDVWQDIHYDVNDRYAGTYTGASVNASPEFRPLLSLITKINPKTGLTIPVVSALREKFRAQAQEHGMPNIVIDSLTKSLDEALRLSGVMKAPASGDLDKLYSDLRYDLKECTSFGNAADYGKIRQAFVYHAGLFDRIEKGEQLIDAELDQLITFPAAVRKDPSFASNMQSSFLADFDKKIVTHLRVLKDAGVKYTPEENVVAKKMQEFWSQHGKKIDDIYRKYMHSKKYPGVYSRLEAPLKVAKDLNCGPSWEEYSLHPGKLRTILTEAAKENAPVNYPDYAALLNAGSKMSEALVAANIVDIVQPLTAAKADYQQDMPTLLRRALEKSKKNSQTTISHNLPLII